MYAALISDLLSITLMKLFLFISTYLFSLSVLGQNPYEQFKGKFYRDLFDRIPIEKGAETDFFDQALKLYQENSLKKAGQIFDRIYWLDTSATLGKQALELRKQIENKVIDRWKEYLN